MSGQASASGHKRCRAQVCIQTQRRAYTEQALRPQVPEQIYPLRAAPPRRAARVRGLADFDGFVRQRRTPVSSSARRHELRIFKPHPVREATHQVFLWPLRLSRPIPSPAITAFLFHDAPSFSSFSSAARLYDGLDERGKARCQKVRRCGYDCSGIKSTSTSSPSLILSAAGALYNHHLCLSRCGENPRKVRL